MKRLVFLLGIFFQSLVIHLTQAQSKDNYVILISLDGYRHDYTDRFHPPNISQFIKEGVAAESLIPSFPSKTFPNHYTIATGLKPENHGLVDNTFYDPERNEVYRIHDRDVVGNGAWYGGTPIWVLAEKNGLKAASYFFVGSEAAIQGIRPSYFYNYDAQVSNLTRISKVFEWLALPEEQRPRLITLYFSDMDDVGHAYGPNNDEKIRTALMKLDAELGALFEGVKQFNLNINILLVSDHGMTEIDRDHLINLEDVIRDLPIRVLNNGALAHVHLDDISEKRKVIKKLLKRENHFRVVKMNRKAPYDNRSPFADRLGDFLIVPDYGYYLTDPAGFVKYQNRAKRLGTQVFGEHGFSPEYKDMQGIFYANGPGFKSGKQLPAFESIDVYPAMCHILGLSPPDQLDGNLLTLKPVLVQPLDDIE